MRWELKLVGCSSSLVENLEGADVLVIKLLLGSWEMKVGSVQPYAISNVVVSGSALLLVVLCLHIARSPFQGVVGLFVDLQHGRCEFGGCGIHEWRRTGGVRKDLRIPSIEYHERTLACRAVNPIVVGKFSEWEPVAPVGLLIVDEDSEVLLDLLVDSFCLAIRLRMEGSRGIRRDVEHSVKFFHELGDKLWSLI